MNQATRIAAVLLCAFCATSLFAKPKRDKLTNTIVSAEYVLEEVMRQSDTAIPPEILQDAKGIILTVNYRGGFFIGGHGGFGILIAKNPHTKEWGVPGFVKTGGANIGLQLGVKEFDTVFVIMDDETIRRAYSGRFEFGADAAAVAGPVYRSSESRSYDIKNAKVLVYTSKKGLYAGVALKAGWVSPNNRATRFYYETDYSMPEIIMSDWFRVPTEANALMQRLKYYTGGNR